MSECWSRENILRKSWQCNKARRRDDASQSASQPSFNSSINQPTSLSPHKSPLSPLPLPSPHFPPTPSIPLQFFSIPSTLLYSDFIILINNSHLPQFPPNRTFSTSSSKCPPPPSNPRSLSTSMSLSGPTSFTSLISPFQTPHHIPRRHLRWHGEH